jgi:hypothetical protein
MVSVDNASTEPLKLNSGERKKNHEEQKIHVDAGAGI